MVTLAGQVIAGAVLSSTTMIWLQVLKLPQSSCARQVRVIVRSCGQLPPIVTSVKVIAGEISQLSVAVAMPVLAGKVLAVHCTVTLGGQAITGAVLSSITMICTQVLKLPQSSVDRHVLSMVYSCEQLGEAVVTSM